MAFLWEMEWMDGRLWMDMDGMEMTVLEGGYNRLALDPGLVNRVVVSVNRSFIVVELNEMASYEIASSELSPYVM
jgi:hypothetical protein